MSAIPPRVRSLVEKVHRTFRYVPPGPGAEENVTSEAHRRELIACMKRLRASDFLLSGAEVAGRGSCAYMHVHETNAYTVGIFLLPRGGVLPIHDHPSMSVLSKVLYGQLRIRWYDPCTMPLNETHFVAPKAGTGAMPHWRYEDIVCAHDDRVHITRPTTGNIHELHALEDCAVLDVLTPPYDITHGTRPCNYYAEIHPSPLEVPLPVRSMYSSNGLVPSFTLLHQVLAPADHVVTGMAPPW